MAGPDQTYSAFRRFLRDRTPRLVVTPLLVSVNVAIYVAMLVSNGQYFAKLRGAALYGPLVETGEWWRALSSAFVHTGFWHLMLNMLALVFAGPLVERLVGPLLFLVCYLATAIIASSASLLMHPTQLSVGASGAVFGVVGMLVSITIRGRQLSARQVLTETVAAIDAGILPVSRSITNLGLSSQGGQTHHVGLAPADASKSPPEHPIPRFADDVLRTVYAGVFPFIVYNLASGLEPGIDDAAHLGGLVGGVVIGWFVASDIIVARPSIVRAAVPIGIAVLIGGAAVVHLHALVDIRFDVVRFDAVDRRTMAAFNAALSEVQSRVRSPDAVVTLVEARILPELLRERSASNNFISEFQKQLAEVEWKDQHGRMPRWRELEPSRKRLAQAIAWRDYLCEREAGWRLRVEALRDGGSEQFAEANRRDAAAASHLTAAFRGSE